MGKELTVLPFMIFPCFGGDSMDGASRPALRVWGGAIVVVEAEAGETPDLLRVHRGTPGAQPHSWCEGLGRREPRCAQAPLANP